MPCMVDSQSMVVLYTFSLLWAGTLRETILHGVEKAGLRRELSEEVHGLSSMNTLLSGNAISCCL